MVDLASAREEVNKCKGNADLIAWECSAIYKFVRENQERVQDEDLQELARLVWDAAALLKACRKPQGLRDLAAATWNASDTAKDLNDMFLKLSLFRGRVNSRFLEPIAKRERPILTSRRALADLERCPDFLKEAPTLGRLRPMGDCCLCFKPMYTKGGAAVMNNTNGSFLRKTTRCKHFLCQQVGVRLGSENMYIPTLQHRSKNHRRQVWRSNCFPNTLN